LDLNFHSNWIDFLVTAHKFLLRNHEHVRDNPPNETQLLASIVITNLLGGFSRQLMWFVPSFQNQSKKTLRTPRNSTWYMQLSTIVQYVHQHPEIAIAHS